MFQGGNQRSATARTAGATPAARMHTSHAQVDRTLKAKGNVTIDSLQRAAALVGKQLRLELV